MDDGIKQRLVGALVLTALAVIFLPSLFSREERVVVDTTSLIPPPPKVKPIVIPEPVRPQGITSAPPPGQAFQPEERFSSSSIDDNTTHSPGLDKTGLPKAWTVQIASFIEPKRAKKLRDKLLAVNYNAYLRVHNTDKGEVTRVFIGPQIDRRRAVEVKKKIDKKLSVNSLVLSFKPNIKPNKSSTAKPESKEK